MTAPHGGSLGQFGVIGLGVMGQNLAQNVEDHGFRVAVWNYTAPELAAFMAAHGERQFIGAPTLPAFVAALERPRRILIMVTAGAPVDSVLGQLKGLVEAGDIVIDGGNSWFKDTRRREAEAAAAGYHFVGMGVSGGEEGARRGPSLMPGGTAEAWTSLRPVLEAIAARTESGPCVTRVGPDGAGHFVKMVHNGIEYADMQLIAEAYDLLRAGLGAAPAELAGIFRTWNEGDLDSFLIQITADVLAHTDAATGRPFIDIAPVSYTHLTLPTNREV